MQKHGIIDLIESAIRTLDIEAVRKLLDEYFRNQGKLALLPIEPNRPASQIEFSIVGYPPPARRRSHWYRCSYCETNLKFRAGHLILGSDGRLRLIGLDCWKHHLDETAFKRERGDYQRYKQHQAFLSVQPRLIAELESYCPTFRVQASDLVYPLRALEAVSRSLSSQARPVWIILDRLRKAGSSLTVERLPTESERRAAELRGQTPPRSVSERMGVASGLELLSSTGVAHEIEPTIEKLNELESICKLQDWASATSNDVWSRLARVKKLTSAISEAVARINSFVSIGRDFLDGVNMSRIVRWINHPNGEFEGRGKLTLEDRRLVYEGNDGSFGVVPLPDASRLRHVPTPVRAVQLVTEMTR